MTAPQPGWYPDQADPRFVRWWDGRQWTQHRQPAQQQGPPASDADSIELDLGGGDDPTKVQAQAARAHGGEAVAGGGGTLFTEPILVVNQKAKLWEMASEYSVFDQHGNQLGFVAQVGQSGVQKAMRMFTDLDSLMTHRFEIRDAAHQPVLRVTRPRTMFKSKFLITRGDDAPVGEIVQENLLGKIRFGFLVNGQKVGGINAENWRAWNFAIVDHTDTEVARITKTFAGLARSLMTTADNYVVQLHRRLEDPLASMVVASALTVDTALKQNEG